MKSFLVMLGAAALVSAQADSTGYFPGEPSCALPCLSSAIPAAGCQLSDIACQCGPTQSDIATKVQGCLISKCGLQDLGAAYSAGLAVCSSFRAGELSFTNPGGPEQTPTPVTGSGSSTATETSVIITAPPTQNSTVTTTASSDSGTDSGTDSGSESTSITSGFTTSEFTRTDTSDGITPTITEPLTSLSPISSPGAAATPAKLGAGVLAGILGAVAFL